MITVTPQPATNVTVLPGGATAINATSGTPTNITVTTGTPAAITFASPQAITVTVAAAIVASGSGGIPAPPLPVVQNISALRIVANLNGLYDYADPLDPIASWSIAGISMQAVNSGGLLTPVNNQSVSDQSWNWVRGSPVFLGAAGTLTQTPPITGNLVVVARVLDAMTLFIHIEDPIVL